MGLQSQNTVPCFVFSKENEKSSSSPGPLWEASQAWGRTSLASCRGQSRPIICSVRAGRAITAQHNSRSSEVGIFIRSHSLQRRHLLNWSTLGLKGKPCGLCSVLCATAKVGPGTYSFSGSSEVGSQGSKLSSVITALVCLLAGQSLGSMSPISHLCTSGSTSTSYFTPLHLQS